MSFNPVKKLSMMLRVSLNWENCMRRRAPSQRIVLEMRGRATYDEDTVTGLVQLGQHRREQDELGRSLGEVGVLLQRALSARFNLG